jgi:hypothetical protein
MMHVFCHPGEHRIAGKVIWQNTVRLHEVSDVARNNIIRKVVVRMKYDLERCSALREDDLRELRPQIAFGVTFASAIGGEEPIHDWHKLDTHVAQAGRGHEWEFCAEGDDIRSAGFTFFLDQWTELRLYHIRLTTESTPRNVSGGERRRVMSIGTWADLGIGIDVGQHWAFSPCPTLGQSVVKSVPLPLRSRQLRAVLGCFAESADGRSARKAELVTRLGFAVAGHLPAQDARAQGLPVRGLLKKLADAMADFTRQLRALIEVRTPGPAFESTSDTSYQAAFTVRYLLNDESRGMTFGGRA